MHPARSPRVRWTLLASLALAPLTAAFALGAAAPAAPPAATPPAATDPARPPATAPAAEEVDNPQFANWSRFNIGSNSTLTTNIDTNGQKISTESTNTLLEKSPEKVVVEISGTMEVLGQKQPIPAQKQTIPARIEKQSIKEVASEKVDAAGKTLECKVYEMVNTDPSQAGGKAKVWISDEVPGGVVKLEANMPRGSVTGAVKSFEVK